MTSFMAVEHQGTKLVPILWFNDLDDDKADMIDKIISLYYGKTVKIVNTTVFFKSYDFKDDDGITKTMVNLKATSLPYNTASLLGRNQ